MGRAVFQSPSSVGRAHKYIRRNSVIRTVLLLCPVQFNYHKYKAKYSMTTMHSSILIAQRLPFIHRIISLVLAYLCLVPVLSFQLYSFRKHPARWTCQRTAVDITKSSSSALFQSNWISSLFEDNSLKKKRAQLKQELLQECASTLDSKNKRSRIESILDQLSQLQTFTSTASSPLLRKTWKLLWTTEKEINFFIDQGISLQIYQTISTDGADLSNSIEFRNGGGLFVTGMLSTSTTVDATAAVGNIQNPLRNYFKFDTATLELQRIGKFSFPPVGSGWFDTIYLDDDLRCDVNSRKDILICTPLKII